LVAIDVMIKASIADEPAEQVGIRYLIQQLLAGKLETAAAAKSWEGQIGGEAALDYVELHTVCTSEDFETAAAALAQVLLQPSFRQEEVAQIQRKLEIYSAGSLQSPFQENYVAFREVWYGDFPYGRRVEGYSDTLADISLAQVQQFYGDWFLPNNTVIGISGNVGPERARRVISGAFKDWQSKPILETARPELQPPLTSELVVDEDRNIQNAHLLIGLPAPAVGKNQEFAAFQVVYSLLAKRSGRINAALRDRLGLAYDINCYYPTLKYPSHLCISVVCRPEGAEEVKAGVLAELAKLRQEPVSEEELTGAKNFLLGQHLVSRQRNLQQAYFFTWYETLGLGAGFEDQYPILIGDVTPQAVQEVAKQYFSKMVIALLLPE
jgi:predicted Zn-dependent peptidase